MTDIEYLQNVHVAKLQTAARMAGMRWKSGTPGFDKASIIAKLQFSPSVMRACVANLRAMENGQPQPLTQNPVKPSSGLLDDMADELGITPPPALPAPVAAPIPLNALEAYLLRSVYAENREFDNRNRRAELNNLQRETAAGFAVRDSAIEALKARVIELSKQAPVQFVVDNKPLPVVTGQHREFKRLMFWLELGHHLLLVGPASSGKTTAAIEYAKLKGLELYSQPLTMDSFGVLGFVGPQGRVETEFSRAWIHGGVFLWDELSMSSPEAIGALNAALANGFASFPGLGVREKHKNFRMIAGDNSDTGASLKYGARALLDGASLDRFIRLDWLIDPTIENGLGGSFPSWLACVRAIRAEIEVRDIAHVGATMRATIAGCKALATQAHRDGLITRQMILEDTCRRGALIAEWPAMLNLPAVRAFLQGS